MSRITQGDLSRIFHAAELPERIVPHESDEIGEHPLDVAEADDVYEIHNFCQDVEIDSDADEDDASEPDDAGEVRIRITGAPQAVAAFFRRLAVNE